MDTAESAMAGIRSALLRVWITPVKSASNKIMAIGFLVSMKYRLIAALDASAIANSKPAIEQTHKAILRALMFSGV